jgi:hypothetical protein
MVLSDLKGSNVVCPHENVSSPQKFVDIICHPFQIMKNINGNIPNI